jgi:hypothetical protein
MLNLLPRRANERMDKLLASSECSTTDNLYNEPTRLTPATDNPDPKRTKLRTDMELDACMKSVSDMWEPSLANERKLKLLPKLQ